MSRTANTALVWYDMVWHLYAYVYAYGYGRGYAYGRRKFSNFRQYGQMKSRAGQRQREEKDQKRKE